MLIDTKLTTFADGVLTKVSTESTALIDAHAAWDAPILHTPQFPPIDRIKLRLMLGFEEFFEMVVAAVAVSDIHVDMLRDSFIDLLDGATLHDDPDNRWLIEVADALGDQEVILRGTALEFGMNLSRIFQEVHRSNMTKLGPDGKAIRREDGKILKGPSYDPPHLEKILGLDRSNHDDLG